MNKKELMDKCIAFHGHYCGGLTIGFQAALYAMELLELDFSSDEEIVCVAENDACGVDAIQVILGCSIGKGNLLFKMRGKQAFSFFNRKTGKSVRMILKDIADMSKEEKTQHLFSKEAHELFVIMQPNFELPEEASIFISRQCSLCGEKTAENMMRMQDGDLVCLDCFKPYNRFMN